MLMLPPFVGAPTVNRVYQVDALTLLRALPPGSVDAVITDPPYGLGNRTFQVSRDFRGKDKRKGDFVAIREEWDKNVPTEWMSECLPCLSPSANVCIFGGKTSIYISATEGLALGWKLLNDVTWIKPDPPPNFTGRMMTESTERMLWFCPDGERWTYNSGEAKAMNGGVNLRDVWRFRAPHGDRIHPSQKPLDLMERCILLFTKPGDLVVDPFAGSGTTGAAAIKHGRRFIGCDSGVDTKTGRLWSEIANERIALPFTAPMFADAAS